MPNQYAKQAYRKIRKNWNIFARIRVHFAATPVHDKMGVLPVSYQPTSATGTVPAFYKLFRLAAFLRISDVLRADGYVRPNH